MATAGAQKSADSPGADIGAAAGVSESAKEVLHLAQEALHLAQAACHFDKAENYVGAYDYYDKAILNIDEVMSRLPRKSPQWGKLLDLRCQYDDRMEQLKELETRKSRANSVSSERAAEAPDPSSSGHGGNGWRKRQKAHEELNFKEMNLSSFSFVEPPATPALATFWLLNNLQRTIETGGYLTSTLFIPSKVWVQNDVKFTGLTAKTTAFEIIIKLIDQHFYTLYFSPDEDSLLLAEGASYSLLEELHGLQNQLSKPFNFIKEVPKAAEKDAESVRDSVSTGRESVGTAGGSDAEKRYSSTKTLTGFVTALGKNVRKYAEVGLSRLAVALPSKLSTEELAEYRALIIRLCSKAQLLAEWVIFSQALLQGKVVSPHSILSTQSGEAHAEEIAASTSAAGEGVETNTPPAASTPSSGSGGRPLMARQSSCAEVRVELCAATLERVGNLVNNLRVIAQALQDVVCEILLRDVVYLMDKYLLRKRKAFSRMYWDDEAATVASGTDH